MNDNFNDFSSKEHQKQARYLLVAAAVCSPVFYYFMKIIETQSTDSFSFRMLITIVSLISFLATFIKTKHKTELILFVSTLVRVLYLILYLYLLHINQWTIYQRWSYFVLAFIACGSTFSWREYLGMTCLTILAPVVLGFYSTGISRIELVHFHVAMIATLFIIGAAIHAQHLFKKEIYKLTQELVAKSQMAALGEVTAGISHEMNSPIMVVNNSLHQLKRQLSQETQGQEDKKKIEELLQKMHRMMERISIIANALKIYSQENKNSSNERVEISSFIEKIIDSNDKNPVKSGVKISFIKSQTSIFCNINKDQIQQCIINLIDNSIEACQNQAQPHITISLSTLDSYIYINISDNGKGISKEIINKIMQPFFTTKEIGTGMGLGLSVALGIARNHNGDLFLDDSNSMTTFVLKLPLIT